MNKKGQQYIYLAIFVPAILLVSGTFLFMALEKWSLVDSFYYTAMTITTVGYGDIVPSHSASKIIASLYVFVSIPFVLFCFSVMAKNYFELRLELLEKRLRQVAEREKEIEDILKEKTRKQFTKLINRQEDDL